MKLWQRRERLIADIYSTITDAGAWPVLLRDLVAATRSRSARLLVLNAEASKVLSSIKLNIDDNFHRSYVDHYVNSCPWRPELRRKNPGRLYSTYLHFICRQPDYYRTEFFNDWAGPQDIHHGVCGTIYQDSRRTVQLLVQRTRDQGFYSEDETEFFNDFVPHLQQALRLAGEVAGAKERAEAVAAAAGRGCLPFALLDHELRLVYVSPAAEGLLAAGFGPVVKDARLRLRQPAADGRLQELLRQCLRAAANRLFDCQGGLVEEVEGEKLGAQLLVRPIHPEVPLSLAGPLAHVAVYFYDPGTEVLLDEDYLRRFYGLSEAEVRVAWALVAVPDLVKVAQRCHISMHTVRSHLKSIFLKTATGSQAALIKLLLSGPARRC